MIKMTTISTVLCAVCLAVAVGACSLQQKKTAQQVKEMPIECPTAEGDIRWLEEEKQSTAKRISSGVRMVVPAGFVVGIITGTQRTKYQVATGQYNTMLDNKIAEIKAACPDTVGSATEE
jgi:preprotein translocase subunit YajC